MLPISVPAANIPQIQVMLREGDPAALPLSDGLIWGIYARLAQDAAIPAYGLFGVMTSAAVIGLKLRSGRRLRGEA